MTDHLTRLQELLYQAIDMHTRLSGLLRKHFWGLLYHRRLRVENRHQIGIDRICVEVDYSDSIWPNSRKVIE